MAATSAMACAAQTVTNEHVKSHTFDHFALHVYTSGEAMGDNSLLIEGENGLVVIEPQSFYKSIDDFNGFIAAIGKPVEKIVSNYHAGGLASCDVEQIVVVEPMVGFMKSPIAQGMLQHFDQAFGGTMDTRPIEAKQTIPATTTQQWAGVEFAFTQGASSDFPASSINIGGKVYYTHFSPNKMHPSPMQITSSKAVEATIEALTEAKNSGCKLFIGSHGVAATLSDVEFLIEYLGKVKELKKVHSNASSLSAALKATYPNLSGSENVDAMAENLYK